MALSTQTVVSDGSLVLLDISIEYLERSEIAVYFDSVPTTAWAWVGTTDKQITFSPAVPAGVVVLLRRTTDMSAIRHEFSLGAAFTAEYLDEALKQTLHIAQEGVEANFGGDFYADIDMHMNGVHNVADPVAAQDAATKNYVDTGVNSGVVAAAASAASASTSASNSATSASAASTSATNAASSASAAATSATNAAASATSAAGSATTATTQAGNASTSATNAANSATAAAASYDSFDDRYLGPKAVEPTLDNDGAALLTGALYYDTVLPGMRVYSGSAWTTPAALAASALLSANNLSDVANPVTARSNLSAQPLDATLTALAALDATAGLVEQTGADTFTKTAKASIGAGKQTLWIPAVAMIPRISNGASHGAVEMPTSLLVARTLDFDTAADEYAQFTIAMPKAWDEGTVTFKFVWSHAATTTNFGVRLLLQGVALSNDDSMQAAFGTAVGVNDVGGTTNDLYHSDESTAVTIAGTPVANDLVAFQVYRNTANANDTMAIDARLHGIILYYTTDANTDA